MLCYYEDPLGHALGCNELFRYSPLVATVTVSKNLGTDTVKHAGPGAWTRQTEKELVKLFQQGTSLEALAQKYERSPRAIRLKLQRLGVNVAASKLNVTADLSCDVHVKMYSAMVLETALA